MKVSGELHTSALSLERSTGNHWTGDWVGLKAGSNLDGPTGSPFLYRLSYPGS
jgi:hypothetical protein